MCQVVLDFRKLWQSWTENLLQQRFSDHSREGKRSRIEFCACVEGDRDNLQMILELKVDLAIQEEKEAQQKCFRMRRRSRRKIGKSEIGTVSGSSSGATHVPDLDSTTLSSRTLPRCDSGLPRNTQNCTGILENVSERPPAREKL